MFLAGECFKFYSKSNKTLDYHTLAPLSNRVYKMDDSEVLEKPVKTAE